MEVPVGARIGGGRFVVEEQLGASPLRATLRVRDDSGATFCVKLTSVQALVERGLARTPKAAEESVLDDLEVVESLAHDRVVRHLSHFVEPVTTAVGVSVPCVGSVAAFVPGETLADRLRAGGVSLGEAVRLASDLAEALAYLHSRDPPCQHGEVALGSVRLDAGRHGVLLGRGEAASTTSAATASLGLGVSATTWYFSPERRTTGRFFVEDDVWAWGLVSLQLLLQRREKGIFTGESVADAADTLRPRIAEAVARHAVLGSLIEAALRVDKAARPTAQAIADRLRDSLSAEDATPVDPPSSTGSDEAGPAAAGSNAVPLAGLHAEATVGRGGGGGGGGGGGEPSRTGAVAASELKLDVDEDPVACADSLTSPANLGGTGVQTPALDANVAGGGGAGGGGAGGGGAGGGGGDNRAAAAAAAAAAGVFAITSPSASSSSSSSSSSSPLSAAMAASSRAFLATAGPVPASEYPTLVVRLADEDPAVRAAAARIVMETAGDTNSMKDGSLRRVHHENRVPLATTPGMLSLLVRGLHDPHAPMRTFSAGALWFISRHDDNLWPMATEAGLLAGLVAVLEDSHAAAREGAVGTLWNLSILPENKVLLCEAEGLVVRVVHLLGDLYPEVRGRAAGTLRSLGEHDGNQEHLGAMEGLVPGVVRLLADASPFVRVQASGVLWALSFEVKNQIRFFGEPGLVAAVAGLLADDSAEVRENAAGVLMVLSLNLRHRDALRAVKGLVSGLVRLQNDERVGTRERAMNALVNLDARVVQTGCACFRR